MRVATVGGIWGMQCSAPPATAQATTKPKRMAR